MDQQAFAETLRPFVDHLTAFENSDFKVIFMSSKNLTMIATKLDEFQSMIDANAIEVELQQVGGDPWHGIATAGGYTRSEAEKLRGRLIGAGLPKDAYLWRPKAL